MEDQKGLKRLMDERIAKLNDLKEKGVEPYPHSFIPKDKAADLHKRFSKLKKAEHTKVKGVVAGRIRSIRVMGKVSFADLEDSTGRIQLYFRLDNFEKSEFKLLKKLDSGDFLGAEGIIFKTKTGELTIEVKKFTILSKAIRPLPSNWYGLKDPETRYRNRAIDLVMNPEVKKVFEMRTKAITLMREFLEKEGFIEVETPLLQPVYGGANANPFMTHLNSLNMDIYLAISPELYLKRLIVGGYDKVYTICKNFRNEGIDRSHNPEFTMMECYASYWDYNDMMKLTEEMYDYIFKKILGTTKVKFEGKTLDFKAPWKKMTMYQAIKKFTGVQVKGLNKAEILAEVKKAGLKFEHDKKASRGIIIIELFDQFCSDNIMQPTHIIDHPWESTPLCKVHRKNKDLIERFEPFAFGYELGNAYTELNDPIRQRELFEDQVKRMDGGEEETHPQDEEFIEAMEYGMPPTGGLGIGFDRLVMFLTGQRSIRDVIFFPFMRGKKEAIKGRKLSIAPEIFQKFPDLTVGVVLAKGINNKGKSKEIRDLIKAEIKNKQIKQLGLEPNIIAWREAFKSFGAKKYKSSVEAVTKRILDNKELNQINNVVDIYNYICFKHLVPLGGDDLDHVDGSIILKYAKGDEQFIRLNSDENAPPKEGEIVYSDDKEILCRRWNWRECDKSKMTEDTKNVALVVEGLPPVDNIKEITKELAGLIKKVCGGEVTFEIITKNNPEVGL